MRIDGTVDGSVRAAGQLVDVNGIVAGDVLAGASQVTVGGDVNRDVAAGAQNVIIDGTVGRNLMTGSNSLTISGDVGGNVEAESTDVKVTRQGTVDGDLDYWSADKAVVVGEVSGTTTRHDPPTDGRDNSRSGGGSGILAVVLGGILAWIQSLVGLLVLGLVMVFALRRPMSGGSRAVADRLGVSLGVGALVFFTTPMVGGFIFVAGLFIGAWWLAFVLFAVYWLLLLAGLIVGGLSVGRAILSRASSSGEPALAWSLLLGLVLVWLVAAVPFLGWLAAWLVMIAGTGGLVLLWMGKTEAPVKPTPVEVAPQQPVAMRRSVDECRRRREGSGCARPLGRHPRRATSSRATVSAQSSTCSARRVSHLLGWPLVSTSASILPLKVFLQRPAHLRVGRPPHELDCRLVLGARRLADAHQGPQRLERVGVVRQRVAEAQPPGLVLVVQLGVLGRGSARADRSRSAAGVDQISVVELGRLDRQGAEDLPCRAAWRRTRRAVRPRRRATARSASRRETAAP